MRYDLPNHFIARFVEAIANYRQSSVWPGPKWAKDHYQSCDYEQINREMRQPINETRILKRYNSRVKEVLA
jgi:hypothetical protein